MTQSVLLDSCVIFPMPLSDTLLRAAEADLYRIHYSQEILDGATRNLIKKGKMTPEKAVRFQQQIIKTFPEGLVQVPEALISVMTNHAGDRHVLAAAIAAKAEVIVTTNLKHFRPKDLESWNIEAQHPDTFLMNLCEVYGENSLIELLWEQAEDCKKPPMTIIELLNKISHQTPNFASEILFSEYSQDIEEIARQALAQFGTKSRDGSCFLEGENYRLNLQKGCLTIVDKLGRGEILKSKNGIIEGKFLVKDIERFQVFAKEIEQS
ncbi:MAG: hypothetical protein N4J56_001544 [Chroococcidiopsis sp. SAG 2025]|uniref:PIN domain-containing protein n=1 Tax=Chroococcidiopsis sp. SAG 2025 TaxID=171389 RepID=UPI002937480D|nr:PIN domain-containing protein [Chroococcidiopsis sp. SAG 2025]MDV2991890.1 hypothetical protein [Chroococcidiopsis sp. SAG 2025]